MYTQHYIRQHQRPWLNELQQPIIIYRFPILYVPQSPLIYLPYNRLLIDPTLSIISPYAFFHPKSPRPTLSYQFTFPSYVSPFSRMYKMGRSEHHKK